jgi:perosamine synthetase
VIPLAVPNVGHQEAANLQACIETGFVSSVGPFVTRFEAQVAAAAGSTFGVATSSGTTGLHAALVAVGVQPGDLVIIPSLSFIATANAVSHCGATPWILDVDRYWSLDPALLEETLEHHCRRDTAGSYRHRTSGARVAAIMPVHTLGAPADCTAVVALARPRGIPVVADAAAALGALDTDRRVGELGVDLSVISFNGNKTVTAGGGGCIVGDDEALLGLARHLTTTAKVGADYTHDRVGFNYRMTNLQAAVGCAQMERLDEFVASKRRIRARYDAAWVDLDGVECFPSRPGVQSACWLSGLVLPPDQSASDTAAALRAGGVEARTFWKPLHLQAPYLNAPSRLRGVADTVWPQIVTLPCSTSLGDEQQTVIDAVRARLAVQ